MFSLKESKNEFTMTVWASVSGKGLVHRVSLDVNPEESRSAANFVASFLYANIAFPILPLPLKPSFACRKDRDVTLEKVVAGISCLFD
jgi:hypothetical protein